MGKRTIQYLISWDMIISQVATQVIAPFFKQQLTIEISLVYHVASPFPFWLYLCWVMHQLKVPFFAPYSHLHNPVKDFPKPGISSNICRYPCLYSFKTRLLYMLQYFFCVSLHFSNLRTADAFPVEKRRPEMRLLFAGCI